MMMGLWADGWFYISSAGLLISGVLFFFLLGQYRVASEAADVTEGEKGLDQENSAAVRPVRISEETPAAAVASHPLHEPEPKPKPDGAYAGPERRKDPANTTGGISPAVVYLQNIKGELTELRQEMRALTQRVDDELAAAATRDEALIDRLGELTRAVENVKAAAPAAMADAPVPKKIRKVEKALEPAPEPAPVVLAVAPEPEPVPEPKTEPAPSPDETIRMELSPLIAAPPSEPESETPVAEPTEQIQIPIPEQSESAPEVPAPEDKPRRGPVWPV